MKAAIYMRVSTADQKLDLQKDGLSAYAQRAGLQIAQEYQDVAYSGRKEGRPGLEQLMKAARNHEFDVVLVWKFDRFARSVAHLVGALEEFNHLGIRFISVQDQIDTDSPMGKAMFTIIGAMAELESDLISERVKAGMAAAKARGKHVGRPGIDEKLKQKIQEKAHDASLSANAIARMYQGQIGATKVRELVSQVRAENPKTSLQ